ncbi:MAG: NAD(P)-dependent oxidoreductase [Lachnospiraceae bacterium]
MKLLIFGTTKREQKTILEINETIKISELAFTDGIFSLERIEEVKGFDAIWIMTNSHIGMAEAAALKVAGVNYIISRATGIDHLELDALEHCGLKAANVPDYSPNAISEHTVLMLLTMLRKMKREQALISRRNFGIEGVCGREIRTMTIGVVGAGRIGRLTMKALKGFGAKLLVYAPTVYPEVEEMAEYVSLEELFEKSDAIILHCPLKESNYHLINEESLTKCKDGLVLINTARGGLVDGKAVLQGLKSGKISGFGMDVWETEDEFIRKDLGNIPVSDEVFEELLEREDVVYTSHISFLTDQALYEIMRISLENAAEYEKTGACKNEVTHR